MVFLKFLSHEKYNQPISKKISILVFNLYLCRLNCGVLKHLDTYKIQFSGLATGKHDFSYQIDKKFFDCYPYSIVKDGELDVKLVLDKTPNMMVADFEIDGHVQLTCDRCLRAFGRKSHIDAQLLIKFTDEDINEITDDIIVLNKNDYEISIADFLYEHINLAVPTFVRCEDTIDGKGCDEDMIAVLEKLEGHAEEEDEGAVDPRWEMLEKLKKNN